MLANHKGEVPFVILIIPFLIGIALGLNFMSAIYLGYLIGSLLLLSLTFIVLNLTYTSFNLYKIKWLGGLLITGILFLTGG